MERGSLAVRDIVSEKQDECVYAVVALLKDPNIIVLGCGSGREVSDCDSPCLSFDLPHLASRDLLWIWTKCHPLSGVEGGDN